jgi:simple sugar transport system permease protein
VASTDVKEAAPASRRLPALARSLLQRPEVGAVAGTIAVFVFFAIVAGDRGFLTRDALLNYTEVAAEVGILASAVALLMIAGEFDLSVGSMIGFAGMAFAIMVTEYGFSLGAALPLTLLLAGLIGALNGIIVVKTKLPAFIVTLAALFILRGLTIAVTGIITDRTQVNGVTDAVEGEFPLSLLTGTVLGAPIEVAWWLLLTVVASFVLWRTRFGNWIYAVGGDETAARNVGVPIARVKITLFVCTALAAALAAVLVALSSGSADVLRGELKEFQAIAATVIGGTLLTGGYGSPVGAAFGALIFGMVSQGIFFTGVEADWFQVFLGAMLLAAVMVNTYARHRIVASAER